MQMQSQEDSSQSEVYILKTLEGLSGTLCEGNWRIKRTELDYKLKRLKIVTLVGFDYLIHV